LKVETDIIANISESPIGQLERRPVRLRNKAPLLKQIIYRTTEFGETRLPLFDNPEEMLKNKMEK
jgi:hypothetical protein